MADKTNEKKKFGARIDIFIIAGLLLLALAVFLGVMYWNNQKSPEGPYAEIWYRGEVERIVYLSEDQTFSIPQAPQVEFEVKDDAIAFIHSNCPDQVCVMSGWQSRPGHFAACLPNEVLLWVDSAEESGTDVTAK